MANYQSQLGKELPMAELFILKTLINLCGPIAMELAISPLKTKTMLPQMHGTMVVLLIKPLQKMLLLTI